MVEIFFLIGPFLWFLPQLLIVSDAVNYDFSFGYSLLDISKLKSIFNTFSSIAAAGIIWWMFVLLPSFWLITWIPTYFAALLYRYILNIVYLKLPIFESRLIFAAYNAILSAVVSGGVFAITSFIPLELMHKGSPTTASPWIPEIVVVSVVGFCLGLIVGLIPKFTPKNNIDSKIIAII